MMAAKVQCLFYFVVFAAFAHYGTAVTIDIVPETFNEVVSDNLQITCSHNGSALDIKQIIMLEIWKTEDSPLAIIRQDEITSGPGLKSNMQAVGYIDKNNGSSYLSLFIKNPAIEDAGTYSCLLFYLNSFYQLKQSRVYGTASLTVDQTDITAVVTYLLRKVSALEKTTQDQGSVITDQKATIVGQESTLRRQEKQLREQQDLLKNQNIDHQATLNRLQAALNEQDNMNKRQELTLNQQNDSIQMQQRKMDSQDRSIQNQQWKIGNQERQLERHQDYMSEQRTNDSYVSAFSYGYNYANKISAGTTLLFTRPITNIGDDYNTTTGIFTAPRNGLYSFQLFALTYNTNANIYIDLYSKGSVVASLFGYTYNSNAHGSLSSVVSLNAGDQVWPVVRSISSGNALHNVYYQSVFSGYLLRLL